MTDGKQEKVRIIVAFGDIQGYTDFLDEVTNDETEFLPFDAEFDAVIEQAEKETGFSFTDTGDGFMCVVDLGSGHNCTLAIRVLHSLWRLLKVVERLIDQKEHPKPSGFRIVIARGYVFRKIRRDGKISLRGRHINLAHNLLEVARGYGIVCHESVKALISQGQARAHGFTFTPLFPKTIPSTIPPKDAKMLYVFDIKKDHHKSRAKNIRSRKS
jgi:class 3 adenylate cyclase